MGGYGYSGGGGGGAMALPSTLPPGMTGGWAPPPAYGGGQTMMPGSPLPMVAGAGLPPGAMMPSAISPSDPMALYNGGGAARPQTFAGPQAMQRAGTAAGGLGPSNSIAAFLMSPQGQQIMRMLMQGRPPTGGMM